MPCAAATCPALNHHLTQVAPVNQLAAPDFAVESPVAIQCAAHSLTRRQGLHHALGPVAKGRAEFITVQTVQAHGPAGDFNGVAIAYMCDSARERGTCTAQFWLQLEADGQADCQDDKPQRTPEP